MELPLIDSPYIDIHTHHHPPIVPHPETLEVISIYNLEPEEGGQIPERRTEARRFSAGIHPYRILEKLEIEEALHQLQLLCTQQRIQFVGECGLDRLRGPDLANQEKTFRSQIDLAEQFQKPLIIHCVRAFDELIRMEKQHQIKVPAIIHGYAKSPQMALQLYDHGFLLSFGPAMMRKEGKAAKALQELWKRGLPFFLETDGSGLDIREIYEAASNLLKVSTDTLKDAIFATWKKMI